MMHAECVHRSTSGNRLHRLVPSLPSLKQCSDTEWRPPRQIQAAATALLNDDDVWVFRFRSSTNDVSTLDGLFSIVLSDSVLRTTPYQHYTDYTFRLTTATACVSEHSVTT